MKKQISVARITYDGGAPMQLVVSGWAVGYQEAPRFVVATNQIKQVIASEWCITQPAHAPSARQFVLCIPIGMREVLHHVRVADAEQPARLLLQWGRRRLQRLMERTLQLSCSRAPFHWLPEQSVVVDGAIHSNASVTVSLVTDQEERIGEAVVNGQAFQLTAQWPETARTLSLVVHHPQHGQMVVQSESVRTASIPQLPYYIDHVSVTRDRKNAQVNVTLGGWVRVPNHLEQLSSTLHSDNTEQAHQVVWHERSDVPTQIGTKGKGFTMQFCVPDRTRKVRWYVRGKAGQCQIEVTPSVLQRRHWILQHLRLVKAVLRQVNRTNWQKLSAHVAHHGAKGLWRSIKRGLANNDFGVSYEKWYAAHRATPEQCAAQRSTAMVFAPKISVIVPTYRTPERYLRAMIDSVRAQTYDNWELCIADGSLPTDGVAAILAEYQQQDARIRYTLLPQNLGISGNTNAALALATGDYIALFDHDDLLPPEALFEVVQALQQHPYDVLYTDEDKINSEGTKHSGPHFKPDFSWELLRSCNYITHFFIVKKSIVAIVGGFRSDYDGSQDYDFILRCVEQADTVHHIPKILYHWRIHEQSVAGNPASKLYAYEAAERAVADHYRRMKIPARVSRQGFISYRSQFDWCDQPTVSVVILSCDQADSLTRCVTDLLENSTYPIEEVLIMENNSQQEQTAACYQALQQQFAQVRVVTWSGPFHYAAINNEAVRQARGEYILLLNNDVFLSEPTSLADMMGYIRVPGVGVVGAKLLYPNNTIQHAGVVIGLGGGAGHVFVQHPDGVYGYMARTDMAVNYSAVTGACLLVAKKVYQAVDGMDERFAVSFNDVDFCLKVIEAGYRVVYDAYARWYHHESLTRGLDTSVAKRERLESEHQLLRQKWPQYFVHGDPMYNSNWSLRAAFRLDEPKMGV